MAGRNWVRAGGLLLAWWAGIANSPASAEALFDKGDGAPSVLMPNALFVEAGERRSSPLEKNTKLEHTVAFSKVSPRTCAAAAVRVPKRGTLLVTARHCADRRHLEVLDERHSVVPSGEIDAAGDIDLSVLQVPERLPWRGLDMRPSSTVEPGERLCAWRFHRTQAGGVARERICAQVVARRPRPSGAGLLVLSHPYPAGTSGSPLVDRAGKVVGIVVASTGESGLAEPIEGVLDVRFSAAPPGSPPGLCEDSAAPCVSR